MVHERFHKVKLNIMRSYEIMNFLSQRFFYEIPLLLVTKKLTYEYLKKIQSYRVFELIYMYIAVGIKHLSSILRIYYVNQKILHKNQPTSKNTIK